jgi:hypothetical protein
MSDTDLEILDDIVKALAALVKALHDFLEGHEPRAPIVKNVKVKVK